MIGLPNACSFFARFFFHISIYIVSHLLGEGERSVVVSSTDYLHRPRHIFYRIRTHKRRRRRRKWRWRWRWNRQLLSKRNQIKTSRLIDRFKRPLYDRRRCFSFILFYFFNRIKSRRWNWLINDVCNDKWNAKMMMMKNEKMRLFLTNRSLALSFSFYSSLRLSFRIVLWAKASGIKRWEKLTGLSIIASIVFVRIQKKMARRRVLFIWFSSLLCFIFL